MNREMVDCCFFVRSFVQRSEFQIFLVTAENICYSNSRNIEPLSMV